MTTRYTRGVWSLENVENKFPDDDWIDIPNVWIEPPTANTGYFLGGGPSPISKSTVDKIAYATNTTAHVPSADMNTARNYIVGGGSKTVGYCIGGFNGSTTFSFIEKITYATDTSDTVSSPAGVPRQQHAVVGNSEKLYMIAGYQGPSGSTSNIKSFPFATETTSPSPSFPSSTLGLAASGNQEEGFIGAGAPGGSASQVVKLEYSNDNNALIPSGGFLSQSRKLPLSAASSTGAYYAGGNPGPYSVVDKLTFATNNTARIPGANLVVASAYRGGTRSALSAYFGSPGQTCDIMPFETDTCSTLPGGANLSSSRGNAVGAVSSKENSNPTSLAKERWFDGAAPAPTFALWAGGYINASPIDRTSQIAKFTYSTGTGSVLPSSYLGERSSATCSVGAPEAGYWKGGYGYPGPGSYWSNTWKCVYSTDAASEIPALRGGNPGWSSGRTTAGLAVGNTTKGYFGAGGPSFSFSFANPNISRIPWATETNHNEPGANLRNPVMFITGAGNQETGYALGGQQSNGNTLSYVDKLTYATDTRSSGGNMTNYHYNAGSASSDTATYCFGGPNKAQIVDKYVWATDTASTDTALANPATNGTNANGKNNAGLLAGGGNKDSSVQKYTYSTSTSSMEPGNMGYGARYMGGASASNNNGPSALSPDPTPTATTMTKFPASLPDFGFQQGGPGSDEVRKIDFATEVGSEIPARLPNNRYDHCSFTSELASYISGGTTPSNTASSQIDKTVYSTGTSSRVVDGSSDYLEPNRRRSGAAGNKTNGWTMGGTPAKSRIDKFYYSTEHTQGDGYWNNDGPGPNGRYWHSTLSAPEYIYAAGGNERSNFWRFTYGIGSQQEVPGATFERTPGAPTSYGAQGQIPGLGNKEQGYVGGGLNPGATGGGNPFMQKMVYSTETVSSLGEILTGARYGVSNCGNLETGYFLGGWPSNAGPNAGKTMKLTYSSDTLSICPAADTASEKLRGHGSGAKSFGIHTSDVPVII